MRSHSDLKIYSWSLKRQYESSLKVLNIISGAIFIHEVYEKGAAHKDGRLRPGDQILEVMSENLRNVTHSHALQALRQTPNRVKLIIHREDDEIYETLEVELLKKKDRGLGLSIVGKKSGPGVFISEVVKGMRKNIALQSYLFYFSKVDVF